MNRRCGDCTLCCKLVPVNELGKLAGERCTYQRHGKGCTVYRTRKMPSCCALWNCRWLVDPETAGLPRPDRAHYVLDVLPDYVMHVDNESGEKTPIQVVQIWVDPSFPDAHRDPALRAYLDRLGEKDIAALIRYNNRDGFALFPPSMTGGHWREVESGGLRQEEHSIEDVARVLGGKISMEIGP